MGASGAATDNLLGKLAAEAYDFPARADAPRRSYVIATTPRSGSNMLALDLWHSGVMGAPLEYFNARHNGDLRRRLGVGESHSLLAAVQAVRTSPNGIFGTKLFIDHLARYRTELEPLVQPGTLWVYLTRNDKLAQATSLVRASQDGAWIRLGNAAAPAVSGLRDYDYYEIRAAMRQMEREETAWENFFATSGIEPVRLSYEAACEHLAAATGHLVKAAGAQIDESAVLEIPQTRVQRDDRSRIWMAAYRNDASKADASSRGDRFAFTVQRVCSSARVRIGRLLRA